MSTSKIELPIYLSKDHISDFCITLPLCVLLTNEKLLPWYYENFTNICSTTRNKALCFSEFGQTFMGFYKEVFEYCNLSTHIFEKIMCVK